MTQLNEAEAKIKVSPELKNRTLTHSCISKSSNPESSTPYFLIRIVPEEGNEK